MYFKEIQSPAPIFVNQIRPIAIKHYTSLLKAIMSTLTLDERPMYPWLTFVDISSSTYLPNLVNVVIECPLKKQRETSPFMISQFMIFKNTLLIQKSKIFPKFMSFRPKKSQNLYLPCDSFLFLYLGLRTLGNTSLHIQSFAGSEKGSK